LNLVGLLTPGPRVPAIRHRTVVYHDGAPVGAGVTNQVTPTSAVGVETR